VLLVNAHVVGCVANRCSGARRDKLPAALTTELWSTEGVCELRCSDPKAADVSCGGSVGAHTVYVFKGKQGECNPSCQVAVCTCDMDHDTSLDRHHPQPRCMCCVGYTDLGCYVYNTKGHTGSTDVTGTSAGKMSPAECYRLSAAYDFFGLVNGTRCLGFTSLRQAAVAAPLSQDGKGSSCRVPCSGAANTTCGGPSTMQLYARNKPVPQLAPVSSEEQVCRGVGAKGGGSLTSGSNFAQHCCADTCDGAIQCHICWSTW
jgi:hypothetical protein